MTGALAVFSNDLWASFIDLHLSRLAPGATVAVGRYGSAERHAVAEAWARRERPMSLAAEACPSPHHLGRTVKA